jgi:hypothetical protein
MILRMLRSLRSARRLKAMERELDHRLALRREHRVAERAMRGRV